MKNKPLKSFLVLIFCLVHSFSAHAESNSEYLATIYQETFRFINHFADPETGLPYDSNRTDKKSTSLTNIGFYLASLATAGETGLISHADALLKIRLAFASLQKLPSWQNFPVSWINASTLEPAYGTSFSYGDHLGNLIASLLAVKGLYPEMAQEIDAYLAKFDMKSFYDPATKWLKGGYDTRKKDFTIKQRWGDWYYSFLASDTRFLSFYGIASGAFPEEHWAALKRGREEKYGYSYFEPGWQGGGLFMQYVSGIFLDEKNTPIGKSAKNFAAAQIEHAKHNNYAVWGWSACEAPWGEYRGWEKTTDRVVTPHASVLAIENFPEEVTVNLKRLDEMGLRKRWQNENYGFRDSIDIFSGKTADTYLMLDQTMLFLSLANFQYGEIIRKAVMKDETIRRGYEILYPESERREA